MLDKIWVGAVEYFNTKPFIYGLEKSAIKEKIHLVLDYPSNLARRLQQGELDVALLPIAARDEIENAYIFSPYCIAATGKVASVCLFSKVPMEQIQNVYLDYQSRTSAQLIQILFCEYWKKKVHFIHTEKNYETLIQGHDAALIIGDRALKFLPQYPYVYDLAEAWYNFTKLPFVFATWVTNKNLDENFVREFNDALSLGFEHLSEIIQKANCTYYDLNTYYKQNIQYKLDYKKYDGMGLFTTYKSKLHLV